MALNISGPMESIEIPLDVILDAMMKKQGLPCPKYKSTSMSSGFFETEVLFYPSASFLQSSLPPHSILGSPALSLEASKNYAVADAIKYMATDQRKIVKDYSYDELQKQTEINKHLQRKLKKKDKKLAKRGSQLDKAITAADILIDKVSNSTQRIQEILSKNLPTGHVNVHGNHSAPFLDMQSVAAELRYHNDEAMTRIKDTGAYPLYEGFSGDNASSDTASSADREDSPCYSDDLRFDTDGDEIYEEEVLRYRSN